MEAPIFSKSIVRVDEQGRILETVLDDFALFVDNPTSMLDISDPANYTKMIKFLFQVSQGKPVVFLDINLLRGNSPETFFLTGIQAADGNLVLITQGMLPLDTLEEGLLRINNEQANFLRQTLKEVVGQQKELQSRYLEALNEISRLNNELVNLQRELAKKNQQLTEANHRLEELALHDPLTGLFSRRPLQTIITRELAKSRRFRIPLTLALIDLNDFKQVNDMLGHDAGDQLLVAFARLVQQFTRRDVDYAFRMGGDEFLLLFVGADEREADTILQRLQREFRNISEISSLSYGIVPVVYDPADEQVLDELLKEADRRMYAFKRAFKQGKKEKHNNRE